MGRVSSQRHAVICFDFSVPRAGLPSSRGVPHSSNISIDTTSCHPEALAARWTLEIGCRLNLQDGLEIEMSDRNSIRRRIAEVEKQLAYLLDKQEEAESTLQSLQEQLERADFATSCTEKHPDKGHAPRAQNLTPAEKVALFLRLFRGRDGVYPMLTDETCWFLAADFDKECWREDVLAFTETCRRIGIPYAIERSRSGTGAHAWFFFASPVAAAIARKMGSFLITETMAGRHQLSMASYDRLFPNQDTLPNGGFGNLIALPLQYSPRQEGNTVSLNDSLEPVPDQWGFLASLIPIPSEKVQSVAMDATTRGQVIGLQIADTGDDDIEARPWLRSPSRKPKYIPINEPIPREVQGVLSQRFCVEKARLPSAWINHIKRLAAFQNPELYKKQNLRLSTALTPRVISCAEDHDRYIGLPRGCLDDVRLVLREHKSYLELEDLRCAGEPVETTFLGELTEAQLRVVTAMTAHDNGMIVAPPGFGKTVLGTYLIAERKCSTLVLVHRQPLLEQWRSQIGIFLGRDAKSIGRIGGGKRKLTGQIDVAMIQSLSRKDSVDEIVAEYGQVIIDECHHLLAVSFERVLSEVKARYVVGLTATPQRRDGHQPIIHMQIGPVRFKAAPRSC